MTDTPATLPAVAPRWRDELVLALRTRDVPGPRIGEILAEVEEYCADSGLDAETAFGSPGAYVDSLAAEGTAAAGAGADLRAVGRVAVGFVGLVVVLACVAGDGPDVVVTVGWLLGLVVMLAATLLLARTASRTLTSGWRGTLVVAGVVAATLAAAVSLGVLLTAPVATVPDAAALTVGAVLLVGNAVVGTVRARRRPSADVVTAPGSDPTEVRRRNVRADVLAAWVLPAFAVVGVVVLLGLDALLDGLA